MYLHSVTIRWAVKDNLIRKQWFIPLEPTLMNRIISLFARGIQVARIQGLDRSFLLMIRYLSWKLGYHDRVRRLPPAISEVVLWFTVQWVRFTVRFFQRLYPKKYTVCDPYEVRYVNPSDIIHISGLHDQKRRGWVIDGDWDENGDSFDDLPLPRSIRAHYQDNVPWEETPLATEYDDLHSFRQKCEKIERLHDSIKQDGFRLQRELADDSPIKMWERANATIAPFTNEITVDIGRDGELLWNMLGKHRLSIAKALELEEVPVMIYSRHRDWELSQRGTGKNDLF